MPAGTLGVPGPPSLSPVTCELVGPTLSPSFILQIARTDFHLVTTDCLGLLTVSSY